MKTIFSLLLLGILALAGCARIDHRATFPSETKPIAFGSDLGREYVMVRPFSETERQIYFFLHWFPLNHANGIKGAEKQLHEGDGIANLNIKTYYGPVDLFFTVITVGLITTYTIDTHGDIVRVTPPPAPNL